MWPLMVATPMSCAPKQGSALTSSPARCTAHPLEGVKAEGGDMPRPVVSCRPPADLYACARARAFRLRPRLCGQGPVRPSGALRAPPGTAGHQLPSQRPSGAAQTSRRAPVRPYVTARQRRIDADQNACAPRVNGPPRPRLHTSATCDPWHRIFGSMRFGKKVRSNEATLINAGQGASLKNHGKRCPEGLDRKSG